MKKIIIEERRGLNIINRLMDASQHMQSAWPQTTYTAVGLATDMNEACDINTRTAFCTLASQYLHPTSLFASPTSFRQSIPPFLKLCLSNNSILHTLGNTLLSLQYLYPSNIYTLLFTILKH